ncbi:hypothetical protein [Leptospira noguchii]|uniref:hypothetical protein n=1 Tax=Leptospira noguchii TaxID=28182 RepID=UPI001FB73D5F|nr:hypothetical protein [Leptospira noguchii]UOG49245.1 hypothetical protein MAL00_02760 [Leptospira noguchii]
MALGKLSVSLLLALGKLSVSLSMDRSTGYKSKDHHLENVQVHLSNKSRKKMTRWG